MNGKAKTNKVVKNQRTYSVVGRFCDCYVIIVNDEGYETKEYVKEENLDGFIQCLESFGFH